MNIKIVQINKKIVQMDIKIEPINFVHDHFFCSQIRIGHVAAALARPLACPSRSARPRNELNLT